MGLRKLDCEIDSELIEQLNMALALNKEDLNEVIQKLVSSYVSESFMRVAKNLNVPTAPKQIAPILNTDLNYGKANRKIPIWASRPNQNNHKIIKAFLQIQEEAGEVKYDVLAERCSNIGSYQDTFVKDFRGNFIQMKTDASNSHGKVFVVENDVVEIWDEVKNTLEIYRGYFLSSNIGGINVKITNDMTEEAYEIAKMVYEGKLSRTEGKNKISDETGMNIGSAGDYITNFLAMMDGQKYTRTFNTYATKYFLTSIKMDYGEEQFKKALNATMEHVKYYNGLQNGNLNSIQNVIDEFR